jgi:hypothetical protein
MGTSICSNKNDQQELRKDQNGNLLGPGSKTEWKNKKAAMKKN